MKTILRHIIVNSPKTGKQIVSISAAAIAAIGGAIATVIKAVNRKKDK